MQVSGNRGSRPTKVRAGMRPKRTPRPPSAGPAATTTAGQKKRTPAQLSDAAKRQLDHVKQAEGLATYNDVIEFLYLAWRNAAPDDGGMFSDLDITDTGEEEDPYRVPA